MNKILETFKKVAENEGITITALEGVIGASKGVLSRAIQNDTDVQSKWLLRLVENYPLYNPAWLLTGIGKMLQSETSQEVGIIKPQKKLPLIPLDAMAGFGNGDMQINKSEISDYYEVPLFEKRGAKYLIPVAGNSMYPKYASGDLLACKPLVGLNFVQWGKPYVLDTEQGAIVKRLFQHPDNKELLICKSDNEAFYPPFDININSIYKVAIVVGVLRLE